MKLKLTAIIGAVALLFFGGMAFGILAFTSDSKDAPTGAFTTDADSTKIEVKRLSTAGAEVTDGTWLSGSALKPTSDPIIAAVSVKNMTDTLNLNYSLATLNVVDTDGKHLASVLDVQFAPAPGNVATGCNMGAFTPFVLIANDKLNANPHFGDVAPGPQSGDRSLTPGQTEMLCVKVTYDPSKPQIYGATTSGTFRFSADDQP